MKIIRFMTLCGAVMVMAGVAKAATSADVGAPMTAVSESRPALAPMAMNSLSSPLPALAAARVVDDHGTVVGTVQKIDLADGKPTQVEIALSDSRQVVTMDAGKLSYDISNNVVTAALDKSQIAQLPPAG